MPTFADFLTPAGALVAAGVVTSLIEVLKASLPILDEKVSGALQAFAFTGALYVITGAAVGVPTPDAGLVVFMSWLTCAAAAIGLKSVATHVSDVKAANQEVAAEEPEPDPAPDAPAPTDG